MIFDTISNEIRRYLNEDVEISEGYRFSQYRLVKRIMLYANGVYPKGKIDKQGNYKYWIDIASPRIDAEIKNIDFDQNQIFLYSEIEDDAGAILLCNLALKEWMKDNEQSVALNDIVEQSSGWGNVVLKKIKGGYENVDLKNFYVINPIAKTLNDTPVIERHILTQSDLKRKEGVWKNIDKVIKECGNKGFSTTPDGISDSKETPYYEVYERNGEISEKELNEAMGKRGGDPYKFVLAKIIVSGIDKNNSGGQYVLFADRIDEMPYKEYHRGRYNGRWWRPGIYELLFDLQTRANEISNQIARGLEWSSKTLFRSKDRLLANNILTDLNSGDVIRSEDLQQIEVRMQGMDQLIADWNRIMKQADSLCNSYEVVLGENGPAGTPFRSTALINQNANKFFDFVREKLSIALQSVFQDWVMPELLKGLKKKDILRFAGEGEMMNRYYEIMANAWYIKNLPSLPPHDKEMAESLKAEKIKEIKERPEQFIKLENGWLDGVQPRVSVVIDGENVSLQQDLDTLATFINLETDPIRRTALIERAMKRKGISIDDLPKTEQQPQVSPEKLAPTEQLKVASQTQNE